MTAHSLPSCPIPTPAQLQLDALGDFPTSNRTGESLSLTAQNAELTFPSDTLALQATARADSSDGTFIGFSERDDDGLDFLLWPQQSSCELLRAGTYPAGLGGEAFGFATQTGLLMIAGSDGFSSPAVVGALTFDTRTGQSFVVDPRDAMRIPRSFATVTEFGQKLLVAGGESPIHESTVAASELNDTAEVYDPTTRTFESDFVPLSLRVTRHAATVLENGETVLIGGRTEASEASNFIQVVSPSTRATKLLDTLRIGRQSPTVLRLDDGRLFIAGGEDALGGPVGALEWRSADASPLPAPFDGSLSLPPRFDRAYSPLPGGGVLAVGGCEDREPDGGEDCTSECQRGCPPKRDENGSLYDAYWISAEGSVTQLDFPFHAGRPSLLPGSDGRPWLIADGAGSGGGRSASQPALYRFDPWSGSFARSASDLGLAASTTQPRFAAIGLDSFAWLMRDAQGVVLRGARLGTRSAFATDIPLVTPRDSDDASHPAHLVPDHAPSADLTYDDQGPGALEFAAGLSGARKPCVWISDARFADFSAEVDFSSAVTPNLRVGATEFSLPIANDATATCRASALPKADKGGCILLERVGNHASLTLGSAHSEHTIGAERLGFGVCGSELGPTRVTLVSVKRGR